MATKHKGRRQGKNERPKPEEHEHADDAGIRSFWSGTISFGLVSVPVRLYPAQRTPGTSLRMLDQDGTPLSQRYFCPAHKSDVHPEHIVRGYAVDNDEYVVVHEDELEALEPKKSRDIDLQQFVDIAELPPRYFDRAYFLTPSGDSTKAYRLLADVLEKKGRAGIGLFVMRDREYLVAVMAQGGILRAQTLRFYDELRTPEDIGLAAAKPGKELVAEMEQLIDKHSAAKLDPDDLQSRHAKKLRQLVEKKLKEGKDVIEAEGYEPEDGDADEATDTDLLETIRQSLKGRKKSDPQETGKKASRSKASRSETEQSGLAEQPKDVLYERAKELNIPGRSKMSKDELIAALTS